MISSLDFLATSPSSSYISERAGNIYAKSKNDPRRSLTHHFFPATMQQKPVQQEQESRRGEGNESPAANVIPKEIAVDDVESRKAR
jgi:hypothetical protein